MVNCRCALLFAVLFVRVRDVSRTKPPASNAACQQPGPEATVPS